MRLFESILIFEVSLLLLLMLFNRKVLGKLIVTGILVITFALHYFFEGIRWQMYFVYVIVFIILLCYRNRSPKKAKWLVKIGLLICLLFTLASAAIAEMTPVFDLPKVSSKYTVGTQNFLFKDAQRANRRLSVKFWFPTSNKGQPNGVYSENPSLTLDGLFNMPGFVFGHLELVETGTFKEAEVLKTPNKFPLIVYSHGTASTNLDNTALLQEIASNGYIVMAIDYNFSFEAYDIKKSNASILNFKIQKDFVTSLIKKVVPNQVKDIKFTLDKIQNKNFSFSSHIDFKKIALIGHSLGGTTAIDASLKLQGVKSIINMDGPINPKSIEKINNPVLYMSSFSPNLPKDLLDKKDLPDVELYKKIKKWELQNIHLLKDRNTLGFHWVRFKNAGHLDFTDLPFILPIMMSDIYDKYKGHLLKTTIIMDFLDFHLKNENQYRKRKDDSLEWIK